MLNQNFHLFTFIYRYHSLIILFRKGTVDSIFSAGYLQRFANQRWSSLKLFNTFQRAKWKWSVSISRRNWCPISSGQPIDFGVSPKHRLLYIKIIPVCAWVVQLALRLVLCPTLCNHLPHQFFLFFLHVFFSFLYILPNCLLVSLVRTQIN